jgi:hypothetical protein
MTDICAAGAADLNDAGARLTTRKEERLAAPKVVMSREIFESLPTVPCDDIEAPRGASFHKTLMGSQWYMVDQKRSRTPIEIRAIIWETD